MVQIETEPEGVYVMASTLGSLEALLKFLEDSDIPVFGVGIGVVNKLDVKKAAIMLDKKQKEFAVILAFDVKVSADARAEADKLGVKIMTAEIIYHLFDQFTAYNKKIQDERRKEKSKLCVFPVKMTIDGKNVFNKKSPFICAVHINDGQLRIDTPICVLDGKEFLEIGNVAGIEKDRKAITKATAGMDVCVKIQPRTDQDHIMFGRHFDDSKPLASRITRDSIDCLKEYFRDDMSKEDWKLIINLKKVFKIE